jgi:MerR family transcriptional regulator, light-induced transcriptional regulator
MDLFSISQLARYSGIKPHTIRIWEQRYNALHPSRSDGNTRYYDSKQLRRLLNIVSLRSSRFGLHELCGMSDKALFELIEQRKSTGPEGSDDYFISQLISAGIHYDEGHFSQMFSHCLLRYGLKHTYLQVIYPMLVRIGTMWTSDNLRPSYEHFISNLLRRKLATSVDALPPPRAGAPTWLLFLPENEFHDIALLFADYLIRLSGARTIYLGGNMPENAIVEAIDQVRPDKLLLFFVHYDLSDEIKKYLERLGKAFKGKRIFVSGNAALLQALKEGKNLTLLRSVADLEGQL